MKAISLLQPWATLVVIGAKKIETRSWNTKYKGPLLIHASLKMTKAQKELMRSEPFLSALKGIGEIPLGCIIGQVTLMGTADTSFFLNSKKAGIRLTDKGGNWEKELAFGDYGPNRYGWMLSEPISFINHFGYKGGLGLWNFDHMICRNCGCTDIDCSQCIEKTGHPCHWVEEDLCSACIAEASKG